MIIKTLIFIAILSFGHATLHLSTNSPSISSNLKSDNYTGESISPEMVSVFAQTINQAYRMCGQEYIQNAEYIKNKLSGTYEGKFNVLIMNSNVTFLVWKVYSLGGSSMISWTGVNQFKPQWGYIIIVHSAGSIKSSIYGGYQRGFGMTESKRDKIVDIIKSYYKPSSICSCSNSIGIQNTLQYLDGNKWNYICKDFTPYQNFVGVIFNLGEQYLQVNVEKCMYLVWVI